VRKTLRTSFILFMLLFTLMTLWTEAKHGVQKVVIANWNEESIKIDGLLREAVWQKQGYSDFTQKDPSDGSPPTEKTIVWVAYDEKALYIAARMLDSQPDKIIGLLGRRDNLLDSDWFMFALDPYYDRRTGYQFGVSPAGSIVDMTLYDDEKENYTWDGIWEWATQTDDTGWTVEIRIPFDQLRFKSEKKLKWGVNFCRIIKRKNEMNIFAWTPKEKSGYVSNFAKLEASKSIKPGYHIEVLPFVSGKADFSPEQEGNLFKTGKEFLSNAGLDLKMGLKSNLTLDLSFNPDFGQVEVDPAVINLAASEIYYEEKRPFFIEGADIFGFASGGITGYSNFGWSNPTFFYSRRIGRPPQGRVNTDGYTNYPSWTTILATAKITGKIGKNWNIGFINALTEREYAEVDLDGEREKIEVEPFSYYGVLRIQNEFNEGRQGLGIITTSVIRDLRTDGLEDILNRNALSFGIDGWYSLNKNRSWALLGWLGTTKVSGSNTVISNLQRSYLHYYQRPDATHVKFDPNATSLSGWGGRLHLTTMAGNFIFSSGIGAVSPGFDSTDIGYQYHMDTINAYIKTGYTSFHPGKIFRKWEFLISYARNYNFGGDKTNDYIFTRFSGQFLNYLEGSLSLFRYFDAFSNTLTRGGPLVLIPSFWVYTFTLNTDNRKPLVLSLSGDYNKDRVFNNGASASISLSWKPKSNINLTICSRYEYSNYLDQWLENFEDDLMTQTYGSRYVFGTIDQKVLNLSLRFNWIFTPRLSLQAYIQPFIAVGKYTEFKELARPSSYYFNIYGEGDSTINYNNDVYIVDPDGPGPASVFNFSNPDFNYKSLRGTVVLRWEYRQGSTLYVVWTQNREDYANPGDFRFGRDFSNLLKAKGNNLFMIKFTYHFGF
jgi:hypothetical protein